MLACRLLKSEKHSIFEGVIPLNFWILMFSLALGSNNNFSLYTRRPVTARKKTATGLQSKWNIDSKARRDVGLRRVGRGPLCFRSVDEYPTVYHNSPVFILVFMLCTEQPVGLRSLELWNVCNVGTSNLNVPVYN